MALTLYLHPLASYCHKVLIALYENDTPFTAINVDLGDPGSASMVLERWPVGKIPVLHDESAKRVVPETTIIIEYLQQHYPGPAPMLPEDREQLLQARLWDRFFDLHVSTPMQKMVLDRIRPAGSHDPFGVSDAHAALETAYGMIDGQMAAGQPWVIGDTFSLADCSAAPALFFASIVHPFGETYPNLAAYLDRLLARSSVARAIGEAKPYFEMFPYRDAMPARYLAM